MKPFENYFIRYIKLKNLGYLQIDSNQIETLLDSFGGLINLEELYLTRNEFTSIPSAIF